MPIFAVIALITILIAGVDAIMKLLGLLVAIVIVLGFIGALLD